MWSATTLYSPGDVVTWGGNSFTCLNTCIGQTPTDPISYYWILDPSDNAKLLAPLQLPAVAGKPLTTEGGIVLDDGASPPNMSGIQTLDCNTISSPGTGAFGICGAGDFRDETFSGPASFSHGIATTPIAVTTPAVPASATAVTNSTGVDCMVYVVGGTVTEIAIGATSTALIAGGVYLAAGQTITLTYTAAPTWTWLAV